MKNLSLPERIYQVSGAGMKVMPISYPYFFFFPNHQQEVVCLLENVFL